MERQRGLRNGALAGLGVRRIRERTGDQHSLRRVGQRIDAVRHQRNHGCDSLADGRSECGLPLPPPKPKLLDRRDPRDRPRKILLYFGDGHNQVHAVDLGTGKEAYGRPVTIADYTPDHNFMHGGLTYNPSNGLLYAVTGSTCDITPWYGRIVAINTNVPSIAGTFYTLSGTSSPGASGGGIWGPGGGSIDPGTNNVFVATGNADTSQGAAQIWDTPSRLSSCRRRSVQSLPGLSPIFQRSAAKMTSILVPRLYSSKQTAVRRCSRPSTSRGCSSSTMSGQFVTAQIQFIAMSIPTNHGDFVGVPAFDPVTGYVYVGMPASTGIYKAGLAAFKIYLESHVEPQTRLEQALQPQPPCRNTQIAAVAALDCQRGDLREQLYA